MPWARASALYRHLECPQASWLPRAERGLWRPGYLATGPLLTQPGPIPEDDSVLATWGIQMHLAKEGSPDAQDPWLSTVEPQRERLWPAELGKHEVPVAYDCRTGEVEVGPLEGDKDLWKETRGPNAVTGTIDWYGRIPSGEPWVDDLKTGWARPQLTSPQMLFYALVASRHMGSPTVRISITHWRRDWDEPERRWQQVGPAVLHEFEDQVRAAWRRAIANEGAKAGPWCRFCPSLGVCPSGLQLED